MIYATIAIQEDRESAFNLSPYKTIDVEIHNVDRNRNPYEVVYEYVKVKMFISTNKRKEKFVSQGL